MKWILLFVWLDPNAGGQMAVEFNDRITCEFAAEQIQRAPGFKSFIGCVPKGVTSLPEEKDK